MRSFPNKVGSTSEDGVLNARPADQAATGRSVRTLTAVNLLCVCGAVLGVSSLFCTWFYLMSCGEVIASAPFCDQSWNFLIRQISVADLWSLGSLSFLAGTILAFFTTLSGFLQFAGIISCVLDIQDRIHGFERMAASDLGYGVGLGLPMAVLSASVVLYSMFMPLGPGVGRSHSGLRDRLLVFRLGAVSEGEPSASKPEAVRQRLRRFVLRCGRWISFLVAVSLVSVGLVSIDGDLYQSEPPLEQVGGGIEIDVNTFTFGYPTYWGEHYLTLSDGETSVRWDLTAQELSNGSWCTVAFGNRSLGTLEVSLIAVELLGDGQFGAGDSLIMVTQLDTPFEEDVAYGLTWFNSIDTLPPRQPQMVTFVVYDGGIDSWDSTPSRRLWARW